MKNQSTGSRDIVHPTEMKPYIEITLQCISWILNHVHTHRSPEFMFDPGDFISGPSEIVLNGPDIQVSGVSDNVAEPDGG